ncbi:1-acyl-sn-glycerol-3-phosphate acyltransferase [Nonomuraea helvata]|uniref:1-acyl-sn-glycerol-3-phosphate acyltransferase n=1 Tax=Nonomuraea helvata TaxID=37484 RepID=A0ABV5RZH8_9ACTN
MSTVAPETPLAPHAPTSPTLHAPAPATLHAPAPAEAPVSHNAPNPAEAPDPWRPLGPCTTDTCVEAATAAAGPVQLAARLVAAFLVLLAGVPMSLVGRMRATWRTELTMAWARLLLRALGVRLEATTSGSGTPPDAGAASEAGTVSDAGAASYVRARPGGGSGPDGGVRPEVGAGPETGVLVVANHVSWLDPLVLAATVPSRPLAKREIGEWPFIRTLAAGAGALFIDRERLSALPPAVAAVAAALRAGDTVVAFPEGTTWCGRGMGRFRPAVFQAAVDAGAPVRPAVLRYREGTATSTRACYVGDDSLLASIVRVAATRRLTVEITLFAAVRPAAPTSTRPEARTALARLTESRVRANVLEPAHHE